MDSVLRIYILWKSHFVLFFFFFFFVPAALFDQVNREQCTDALFMVPQIPLFSHFFIKNGSHGTIHTFKNYFATMFSVSAKISSIQTNPYSCCDLSFSICNFVVVTCLFIYLFVLLFSLALVVTYFICCDLPAGCEQFVYSVFIKLKYH